MALELESQIMEEIGLGAHFNYFNGSGSCQFIRQDAANKVEGAIRRHNQNGEAIAEPDAGLIATLKKIAAIGDEGSFTLTKTWQGASYVIAEHIHQAGSSSEVRVEAYNRINDYLQQNFLPTESGHRLGRSGFD